MSTECYGAISTPLISEQFCGSVPPHGRQPEFMTQLVSLALEDVPSVEVYSLEESFAWARHAYQRMHMALSERGESLLPLVTQRVVHTSSAFSGVGGSENADAIVAAAANSYVQQHCPTKPMQPICFRPLYAVEVNSQCQRELMALNSHGPECLFADMADFCPNELREKVGLAGGPATLPIEEQRRVLCGCCPRSHAWCLKHKTMCALQRAHVHKAGSHCTMHSSMGKRQAFEGNQIVYFWIWVAMRRFLKEPVVLHENVVSFGIEVFEAELGDLYVCIRCVHNVSDLGHAVERVRQIVVLLLKVMIYPALRDPRINTTLRPVLTTNTSYRAATTTQTSGSKMSTTTSIAASTTPARVAQDAGLPATTQSAQQALKLQADFASCFFRRARFTLGAYLIATPEEFEEELRWARSRPGVKRRHSTGCEFEDPIDSPLAALTANERRFWHQYTLKYPGETGDVTQNPSYRAMKSNNGKLNTLIANVGFVVLPESVSPTQRWLTAQELLTCQGYPISLECQAAAAGGVGQVTTQFSRGHPAPAGRTTKSQRKQAGNAMHLNHIGAWAQLLCAKLPSLGLSTDATEAAGFTPSGFARAYDLVAQYKRQKR